MDSRGYTQDPFLFYLPKGPSTIRLEARQESIFIEELIIGQLEQPKSYAEAAAAWPQAQPKNVLIKVQGEDALYRSHSTLFAISDMGDPTVEPYHPAQIRLNSIGGWRFSQPGQWISWEFEVPESGLSPLPLRLSRISGGGLLATAGC